VKGRDAFRVPPDHTIKDIMINDMLWRVPMEAAESFECKIDFVC
jgi:hypothetical protein